MTRWPEHFRASSIAGTSVEAIATHGGIPRYSLAAGSQTLSVCVRPDNIQKSTRMDLLSNEERELFLHVQTLSPDELKASSDLKSRIVKLVEKIDLIREKLQEKDDLYTNHLITNSLGNLFIADS